MPSTTPTTPSASSSVQRPGKAQPLLEAHAAGGQHGHQGAVGGRDELAEAGPVLKRQHRHLARKADEVGQRREQRHGERGLPADAGHGQVQGRLHGHHAQGGRRHRQVGQRRGQPLHNGIDDVALGQHHENGAGKAHQHGRKSHVAEARHEALGGARNAQPAQQPGRHAQAQKQGRHLVEIPAQLHHAVGKHAERGQQQQQHQPVAAGRRRRRPLRRPPSCRGPRGGGGRGAWCPNPEAPAPAPETPAGNPPPESSGSCASFWAMPT